MALAITSDMLRTFRLQREAETKQMVDILAAYITESAKAADNGELDLKSSLDWVFDETADFDGWVYDLDQNDLIAVDDAVFHGADLDAVREALQKAFAEDWEMVKDLEEDEEEDDDSVCLRVAHENGPECSANCPYKPAE
jgi:hypothetical protein